MSTRFAQRLVPAMTHRLKLGGIVKEGAEGSSGWPVPADDRGAQPWGKEAFEHTDNATQNGLALGVAVEGGNTRDRDRGEAGLGEKSSQPAGRVGQVTRANDVALDNACSGALEDDSDAPWKETRDREYGVSPVAREKDEGAVRAEYPPPLLECILRRVQVLDYEVRVHEIERGILEGEPGTEVGDDEAIDRHILDARLGVEVYTHQLDDLVSVSGEACRSPAACIQRAGRGAEGASKKAGLDLGV
jgi:hypothetical protein